MGEINGNIPRVFKAFLRDSYHFLRSFEGKCRGIMVRVQHPALPWGVIS